MAAVVFLVGLSVFLSFLLVLYFKFCNISQKENLFFGILIFIILAIFGFVMFYFFREIVLEVWWGMILIWVVLVPSGLGCGLCVSNILKWRKEKREETKQ